MRVKTNGIYKIMLFLILLLPILVGSVEFNVVLCLFFITILLFFSKNKISQTLIEVLIPLAIIIVIAVLSSFFYQSNSIDVIKDIVYLIKPMLFIFVGYFLGKKLINKDFIFYAIIYAGLIFAVIHLYEVGTYLMNNPFSVNKIRTATGKDNFIELFALLLILVNKKQNLFNLNLKYINVIRIIILFSAIMYFSRTMILTGIVVYLSMKGYTKISRKGIMYFSSFIAAILLLFLYLNIADIDRNSIGLEGFLYKLKLAPSEIFSAKTDITNHATLWDHWRGYEALKAIEQLYATKYNLGAFFGKGVGSLVDLGFVAPLNTEGMQLISHLHNGYAFVVFKSGLLGVFVYLLFLIQLYLFAYEKNKNMKINFLNNTISGIALFYFFTTLVITGVYNKSDTIAIILGALIHMRCYYKQKGMI